MNGAGNKLEKIISAQLTKRGDVLEGVIRSSDKAKDAKPKQLTRAHWDDALAEHVDTMADGDTVTVEVIINLADNGKRTARLAGVAPLPKITHDAERDTLLRDGGFVNPYTFVPTLPRSDEHGTRLADTGLDDDSPPSHSVHGDGQWSGTLALTLTTVTPLLLPVPAATQPKDDIRTFDVRVCPDGRPLIHGASFKGALRSAYETVTASRYGVFFEHHERLAYRATASAALELTPAVVHERADGTKVFRLCRGDDDWARHSRSGKQAQYAALVPAYGDERVHRLGDLATGPLSKHHGAEVYARAVLPRHGGKGEGNPRTWRVTHLARTEQEILAHLRTTAEPSRPHGRHRIVRGWLYAAGRSIDKKRYERLFVETPGLDIPITPEHERYWRSVLRAYDLAQDYNDPRATYRRAPAKADRIDRSWHVRHIEKLWTLPAGTLVFVKYDETNNEITEVHPVMVGRLPFTAAPDELLHESLRPARERDQLSPADRLFGWVPPGRGDGDTNDGASGYRGRLRVRSITCCTDDWRPPSFPPDGVTLAPLSSPKPTQFRFYAASDQKTGMPMRRGVAKADGYAAGGGLRGRKMYRWREETPEYWQPTRSKDDPARGYLALKDHEDHPTQLVRHRSWVRPGVTFQVELFLDGVREAELGALLWLLTRGDDAPLRLGAGKPYGFGVVTTQLDLERTRLWDAAGVRAGWLRLTRPDPVSPGRLAELADTFAATARGNEVLREATESYVAAAKPVTSPVHYPRQTPAPQAESYKWFVENERLHLSGRGWSLPHVRDPEQRLPYLNDESDETGQGSSGSPKHQGLGIPEQKRRRQNGKGSGVGAGPSGRRPRPGGKGSRPYRAS